MSAISKGFKTMGKAMSQIHQDGNYNFSDSESEQSHAQICDVADVSAYLFMNETDSKATNLKMSDTLFVGKSIVCSRLLQP